MSGNFGTGGKFAAAKSPARNITASAANLIAITGKLSYGGKVYNLGGCYDTEDGNFSLSTLTDSAGVEITGNTDFGGKATVKTKGEDGKWTVAQFDVYWYDLQIADAVDTTAATPLPDAWQGIYDFSEQAGAENWFSANGGEDRSRFVMVLGPYSIDFWANTDLLRGDIENQNSDWTNEQVDDQFALLANITSTFNVVEITKNGDSEYEILLVFTLMSDSPYYLTAEDYEDNTGEESPFAYETGIARGYRKVKMEQEAGGGKITATLVGDDYPYVFKTASEAGDSTYNNSDSDAYPNALVFEPWDYDRTE